MADPLTYAGTSPLAIEADNYNLIGEQKSWFDSASDAITLGSKGAAYSAINSFLDTGRVVGNWFGGDYALSDTYQELLDTDPAAAAYYSQNKEAVDLAGFLAGSIIPGTVGLKAFNLARGVGSGEKFARTLNLFAAPRERAFTSAMEAIRAGAPTIDSSLRANKLRAMAAGFGDQALQATAWETAVASTMGASPVLDNNDWKDIGYNIAVGAILGGTIGGVFDAFGMAGKFNKARALTDFKLRPYEAFTNLGKGDYTGGDRIVALINSLDNIPLPAPAGVATEKANKAFSNAMLESRKIMVGMSDDAEVANALFDTIYKMKFQGGATNDDLFDYLAQATKIQRIGADAHREPVRLEKFLQNIKLADESKSWEVLDPSRPLATGRQALKDDLATATTTGQQKPGVYINKTAAFKAGEDMFLDEQGLIHINPHSTYLRRIAKPGAFGLGKVKEGPAAGQPTAINLIVDLKTGEVSDTALSTIGDIIPKTDIALKDKGTTLVAGDFTFIYNMAEGMGKADIVGKDYLRAHARFVWAAERGIQKGDTIAIDDLPMMDVLLRKTQTEDPEELKKLLETVHVVTEQGRVVRASELSQDLSSIVEDTKRAIAIELSAKPGMTADEMALRLNVPKEKVKDGLAKFQSLDELSPDAAEYKNPSHARVIYNTGDPVLDIDGMIARGQVGVQARITRAKDAAATVFADFAREDAALFPEIDPKFSQATANQSGAGASFLGFTNSQYGSIGEMYEAIGAGTKLAIERRVKLVEDTLAADFTNITQSPAAAAELGVLQNMLRGSSEHYKLVTKTFGEGEQAITGRYLVVEPLANREELMMLSPSGALGFTDAAKAVVPEGYSLKEVTHTTAVGQAKGKYAVYKISDDLVWSWLSKNVALNDERLSSHATWAAAQGINKETKLGRVYAPPIDTRKYKFVAFVRETPGNGAASSSVAALTATSEEELSTLISRAKGKGFDVVTYTKADIKKWHEAKGDYDYNLNLSENTVDSALKREGILSNYFPETRAERVLEDWMSWHRQQVSRQTRNFVELKYGQQFAELRALGEEYTALATSKFQNISTFIRDVAKNPYNDYIKTALNLSKASEYRLWMDANERVEAFFDTAFQTARNLFPKAAEGKMSWEEVNKLTERYGLGKPFVNAGDYLESQKILPPTPHMRNFIQAANGILAAATLRLDFFNSLINIVSTPILLGTEVSSLRRKLVDPALGTQFESMMKTAVPGLSGVEIPATSKLIYNAVNNYFGPESKTLVAKYKLAGVMPDLLAQHKSMIDDLAFHPTEAASKLSQRISAAVDKGSVLTGNRFAEDFTRFVSANVMDQLTTAAGIGEKEALAYIRTFVNRVQGNHIAAQRPVVFQGVLGQAMGLFQTYQFNMMQQLFRHVENGDKKTVATMLGLQSTLFGFQGLPLFAAVNTHIIGNAPGNPTHTDVFSAIPRMVGKDVGDLLLYGGVSWASGTAAYTRGDINPRNISILPINPSDWPAISGVTRFVSNVVNVGQKLADGGKFVDTMLQGLEHNSISRPLAGLAQTLQGYSTTSQGGLIARNVEVGMISQAAHLAGSKPLQTAIALDALYRNTAYTAKDVARKKQLGEAVKTAFVANRAPTEEEINSFAESYAAAGGDIKHFNAFLIDAAKSANTSVVNQFAQNVNNPRSRNMMEVMGGEPLPDFSGWQPSKGSNVTMDIKPGEITSEE